MLGSNSIPTETKNKTANASRNGREGEPLVLARGRRALSAENAGDNGNEHERQDDRDVLDNEPADDWISRFSRNSLSTTTVLATETVRPEAALAEHRDG
jgi:hypothetical protein